ncbi:hypothetical protein IFM89_032710 [Coptis chinensis]|uniref:Uncharacterized protein n=1 Tax=Coptis chinensis TaxID=261450 RepID=A0A835IF88_9MAGN|nr:hypothetical protein IFM89_032710 [Coptis chinensis]
MKLWATNEVRAKSKLVFLEEVKKVKKSNGQVLAINEVLLELARIRNKNPLLKSIAGSGIPLPPEEDTLISPNYQFAIPKKHRPQAAEETEEDDVGADENPPREQKTDPQRQKTPQRVSFPLVADVGSRRNKRQKKDVKITTFHFHHHLFNSRFPSFSYLEPLIGYGFGLGN